MRDADGRPKSVHLKSPTVSPRPYHKSLEAQVRNALLYQRHSITGAWHSLPLIVRTPRIDKALAYIDAHAFDPDISSVSVAMEMGCTRRHADTCFRKSLGRTILEEVQRIRLERTCQLLANPTQEIGAIANLVGYKSDSFFKRLFKRQMGMTMRAYRNSRRSKNN